MRFTPLALLAACSFSAAYDTTIVNGGVNYQVFGVPDNGAKCNRAINNFSKEALAQAIGKCGGVPNGSKKKYPERLNPGNPGAVPALQNDCNIADENVYSAPIGLVNGEPLPWMDDRVGKNSKPPFRIIYKKNEGNSLTYCATAEHPVDNKSDYQGCPS